MPTIDRRLVNRDETQPWRKLYKTARWQKLRKLILIRDGYTCQKTGIMLVGKFPAPNSAVADHKIPVSVFWFDDRQYLFWDTDNIEAVSKAYHDAEKQKIDKRRQY
jgi:5-methylcytosine-specific restriction enzyme A